MPPERHHLATAQLLFPVVTVLVLLSFALARWWPAKQSPAPGSTVMGRGVQRAEARWIWAREGAANEQPASFSLVRDFDLSTFDTGSEAKGVDDAPARDREVELVLASDADVFVTLNGLWLGALAGQSTADPRRATTESGPLRALVTEPTAWHAPVAQQRLVLDRFLRPGANRLVLDVRSSSGAGAVLAALRWARDGAEGEPILLSGGDWPVVRRQVPGVREGWLDLQTAERRGALEAPLSWGTPPLGRYEISDPSQLPRQVASAPLDLRAVPATALVVLPDGFSEAEERRRRREEAQKRQREQEPPDPLPSNRRAKWSQPVTGYLHLQFERPPARVEIRHRDTSAAANADSSPTGSNDAWQRLVLDGTASWRGAAIERYGEVDVRSWGAELVQALVHPVEGSRLP